MLDLVEMPWAKKAGRGGSRHFPKKNENWKTGYATTDNRVMLLPVALSEWKHNRWSTINPPLNHLGGSHISCAVINWYAARKPKSANTLLYFTAVIACMSDRNKLPLMVIFKQKTMLNEKFPTGVIVYVHPKGWMDTDGMLIWLQKAWSERPGDGPVYTKSLIVWDQFRVHLTNKVKQRTAHNQNTDIAIIPWGVISILRPLDHLFKCKLSELWSAWTLFGSFEWTAAGNLKWPSHSGWRWPGILSTPQSLPNIPEVLYQQWFGWHRRWSIVG